MLKSGLFSVIFKVDGIEFREEYQLAYRTEEEQRESSTLYQQAKAAIAKDLNVKRGRVEVVKVLEIHNNLILED